jgi:hypothetical protein
MDRRTIGLIWAGGLVLMVAVYAIGPQHFLTACEQFISDTFWWINDIFVTLAQRAFEVVRAAAIALYAVSVVLAVLAMRRGLRAGGMMFVVTVVFLLLIRTSWYDEGTKWLAAAILTGVSALVLTNRLMHAPRPRDPADPWGVSARDSDRPDPRRTPSPPRP